MKKRNILIMILLTIVTLGLYQLYWYCSFQNQLKKETGKGFGGVGHFFMSIITFGIYYIVWQYKAGRRLASLGAKNWSIIYLLFCFLPFVSILNPFLMQYQANNI